MRILKFQFLVILIDVLIFVDVVYICMYVRTEIEGPELVKRHVLNSSCEVVNSTYFRDVKYIVKLDVVILDFSST